VGVANQQGGHGDFMAAIDLPQGKKYAKTAQ
jgi:hypothetical protein